LQLSSKSTTIHPEISSNFKTTQGKCLNTTGRKLNALLIDDNKSELLVLKMYVESFGFIVDICSEAKAALLLLESNAPDLLITDIVMPDTDGLELIKAVRALHKDVPMIAVSGTTEGGLYLSMAKKFGATATLTKPINPEKLLELLKKIFGEVMLPNQSHS
jgi:two-component system chemotaxis response regulator CheY